MFITARDPRMGRAVLALSDAGRGSLAHLALLDACAEQQRSGADLRVALSAAIDDYRRRAEADSATLKQM
jgi:hypothetical protein